MILLPHPQILELPSKLFYKSQLTCCAKFPSSGPKDVPPLRLVGVEGQEDQDEDSPSFYNNNEATKIAEQVLPPTPPLPPLPSPLVL